MGIQSDYHGIILDLSQKNKSILKSLDIIGTRKVLFNLVSLLKVRVPAAMLEETILKLQGNMRKRFWPLVRGFYFHFYNEENLIVVFKYKISRSRPDPRYFGDIIEYGKGLGIPDKQLDFIPYRFQDERY